MSIAGNLEVVTMAMFSFSKSSFEKRLAGKLQDKFVTTVMRNKILAKWAGVNLGLSGRELDKYIKNIVRFYIFVPSDWALISRIEGDFERANIKLENNRVYYKLTAIEKRLSKSNVKRSLPKK